MKRDAFARLCAVLSVSLLVGASAALAVDGVIEINDASVQAAGGYPAVIGAPGSYVLTGNLTAPFGSNAIDVFAPNVTIDLNGFQVLGPGGVGVGINGTSTGLSVRNGSVSGFTIGIASSVSGKIFQVHVTNNTSAGIIGGGGCLILQSTIAGNGNGIDTSRCKIENNVVEANTSVGIVGFANLIVHNEILSNGGGVLAPGGGVIRENVFEDNAGFGISDGAPGPAILPPPPGPPRRLEIVGNTIQGTFIGPGISTVLPALIADNLVSSNATDGILCGAACTVRGNVIESNNIALAAASGGVTVADGSNVTENSISFNAGFGLTLPVTAGYSQNTFSVNGGGLVDVASPPHPTAGFMNLCSGIPGPTPTCP